MLVYKATNKLNGKAYIGFTGGTMEDRRSGHYSKVPTNVTNHFHRALGKYNVDDWTWEILTEAETLEEISNEEVRLIAEFDTFKNGYNSTTGGEAGFDHTEEFKARIAEINSKPKSPEHRAKLAALLKSYADKRMEYAVKPKSKDHRQNISESCKGWERPQTTVECPHCHKSGGSSLMKRWHFDNCKTLV